MNKSGLLINFTHTGTGVKHSELFSYTSKSVDALNDTVSAAQESGVSITMTTNQRLSFTARPDSGVLVTIERDGELHTSKGVIDAGLLIYALRLSLLKDSGMDGEALNAVSIELDEPSEYIEVRTPEGVRRLVSQLALEVIPF